MSNRAMRYSEPSELDFNSSDVDIKDDPTADDFDYAAPSQFDRYRLVDDAQTELPEVYPRSSLKFYER